MRLPPVCNSAPRSFASVTKVSIALCRRLCTSGPIRVSFYMPSPTLSPFE